MTPPLSVEPTALCLVADASNRAVIVIRPDGSVEISNDATTEHLSWALVNIARQLANKGTAPGLVHEDSRRLDWLSEHGWPGNYVKPTRAAIDAAMQSSEPSGEDTK